MVRAFIHIKNQIAIEFAASRLRWPLFIPVCFALGIGLYFISPAPVPFALLLLAILLFLLGIKGYLKQDHKLWLYLGFLGIALAMIGHFYADFRLKERTIFVPKESYIQGKIAKVTRIDHLHSGRTRYWLLPELSDKQGVICQKGMLRLIGNENLEIMPNMMIKFDAMIFPPSSSIWKAGFSFDRYAYLNHICATGYMTKAPTLISNMKHKIQANSPMSLQGFKDQIAIIRDYVSRRFNQQLTGEAGGVAAALSVGDRSNLSKRLISNMQASGLSHLLAISGLHLGLVATIIFTLIRWAFALFELPALLYNSKKYAAFLSIPFIFGYLLLAGATPPTQRAFMMTSLFLFAILINRRAFSIRPLALAAMVILLVDPALLISASFQLSFAAVLALICYYDRPRNKDSLPSFLPPALSGMVKYFKLIFISSLLATIATTPLVAWHFGQFSWVALCANLLAIPLMAITIMPLLIASLIMMPLGLDAFFIFLAGKAIDWLIWLTHSFANLPLAGISIAPPHFWLLMLFIGCGIIGILFENYLRKLFLGLCLTSLALMLLLPPRPPDILISADQKLIALYAHDGYWINQARAKKFVRTIWQERSGQKILGSWQALADKQREISNDQFSFSCNKASCQFTKQGLTSYFFKAHKDKKIVFSCPPDADLIILPPYSSIPDCDKSKVIAYWQFHQYGWHHFYLNPKDKNMPIETMIQSNFKTAHPWNFALQ